MTQSIDSTRLNPVRSRRQALGLLGAGALMLGIGAAPATARGQNDGDNVLTEALVLRDPDIPVAGNADGDITIVEYFDYRCLTCKKVNPVLQQIVHEDGHIRLVFKDWPIFGGISIYAAQLGLAAKFQNKFSEAHEALISLQGKLSEDNVLRTLAKAGIDISRAQHDLATNQKEIDAILARNQEQATALGFEGTPAIIIGHLRVPGVFNTANFKQFIADARAAAKRDDDGR
jgi:protein-disulfide isomerase